MSFNGIKRPAYNRHQVTTGKYAKLGEFLLEDGNDYEGMYHILPNGQFFTETFPSLKSRELIKKIINISEDVRTYNRISSRSFDTFKTPVSMIPVITDYDIDNGYIERFFVQKRNNPQKTITEIDFDQYTGIGDNAGSINKLIWNSVFIRWRISKLNWDIISALNGKEIEKAENIFPGIKKYLVNKLEFSKV